MIGPLLAVAVTRVAGWAVSAPPGGRQGGQWIIGTALGLYFTPAVAERVSGFIWLLVLGALFAIAVGYLCGYFLSRWEEPIEPQRGSRAFPVARRRWRTSASVSARVDEVAAAQSLRTLPVLVTILSAFAALGFARRRPLPRREAKFTGPRWRR